MAISWMGGTDEDGNRMDWVVCRMSDLVEKPQDGKVIQLPDLSQYDIEVLPQLTDLEIEEICLQNRLFWLGVIKEVFSEDQAQEDND